MKRHSTYSLIFVSFLLLASVSCRKEDLSGSAISFMASSRESITKVGYSDKQFNVGGSNFERVDWKVGDLIRIFSPDVYPSAGFADYKVRDKDEKGKGGIEARNEQSIAHVEYVNGQQLKWNGNKPHSFYCVYPAPPTPPAPATGKVTTGIAANSITGSIPDEQTYKENLEEDLLMQVGYTRVESPEPSVNVDFTPVTTCLDFTISNGTDTDMIVTSVTLKRNPDNNTDVFSGGFEVSFEGTTVKCKCSATETGDSVTLTFPDGKQSTLHKSTTETLRFRIFLNPGNDITSPKFIIRTADGNVRSTILKKNNDITFKAMHKTNVTGIAVKEGLMLTSFGEPQLLSWEDEPEEELGIEAEYRYVYDDSGLKTKITDVPYEGGGPYDLGSVVSYRVKYDTKDVEAVEPGFVGDVPDWITSYTATLVNNNPPTYNVSITVGQNIGTHADVLKNAPPKGTAEVPFDLSYYNPSTLAGDSRNTANCYVVNAPGYYKFPLVYGNTIKDGAENKGAYNNSAFKNAYNESINRTGGSYKIDADITTTHSINGSGTIPSSSIVTIDGFEDGTDYKYIKFHIYKTNIKPDNVLITIKSGNDIVWSWHIWVTDVDLSNSPSSSPKIMPVNLGWISGSDDTFSSARECTFKFGNAGETATLTVSQLGKPAVALPSGTSVYYQWGRKDPSFAVSSFSSQSGLIDYYNSIIHPDIFYQNPSYYNYWTGDYSEKFWDNNGKTIYDPCPVGFKVISESNANTSSNVGYSGTSGNNDRYAKVGSIYLPVYGYLKTSTTPDVKGEGFYWTNKLSYVSGMVTNYWGRELHISGKTANIVDDFASIACLIRPQFE